MRALFAGSGVALATPFTEEGVDYPAYERMIERQIAAGTDALVPLGTTGEPSTLSDAEIAEVIGFAVKTVAGRVPVVAGAGGNDTRRVLARCARAERLGADALLVVTPYYNKTSREGLLAHYRYLCERVALPVIVYNVPARTGLNVTPETAARLAEIPGVAGFKEASGDLAQAAEYARLCPEASLYAGNDDTVLPMLALGGKGVISVVANVAPRAVRDMTAAFFAGDLAASRALQFRLNPLVKALFSEVSPIPLKAALAMMGLCEERLRLPLVPLSGEKREALRRELERFGVIPNGTGAHGRVL